MPSSTVTRQDATQVIAEFATNMALLLDVLDDLPGTKTSTSRQRDELALIARLQALATSPDPDVSPDTRQLLHSAFTLARIRSRRMMRHVRGGTLQRLRQRLRSLMSRLVSRRAQPTDGFATAATAPDSMDAVARVSQTLLSELDQKRRALSTYLDHYRDGTGAPDHPSAPNRPAASPAASSTPKGPRAGTIKPARAGAASAPRQQKPGSTSTTRSKPRPNISKRA